MRSNFFLGLFLLPSLLAAQNPDTVCTLPFHLDTRLLVFEGVLNGQPTALAFDTGANLGLANSRNVAQGKVQVQRKKIKMRDALRTVKRVPTGSTAQFEVGCFEFKAVKSLVSDMAFLQCLDYYLLGANVISELNWVIDFEKREIQVSRQPFTPAAGAVAVPIQLVGNRPYLALQLAGQTLPRVLVDFGYTQILNLPSNLPALQPFLREKDQQGRSNLNLNFSMGALTSQTDTARTIVVDSIQVGSAFFRLPVDFERNTSAKIGLDFFASQCQRVVLNHTQRQYHLERRVPQDRFPATRFWSFRYLGGKIVVAGKPLGLTANDDQLALGEEIASLNGKTAADFADECAFLEWSVRNPSEQVRVVKKDGTVLEFGRIALK